MVASRKGLLLARRTRVWLAGVTAGTLAMAVTLLGMGHGYPTVHFAVHPGAAWVSSNQTGQLTLIDGPSARAFAPSTIADTSTVIERVNVAPPGNHLTIVQQGANAFAVNQTAGSVTRVDGTRVAPSAKPDLVADSAGHLSAFAAGDVLYLLDEQHGLLSALDSRSLNPLGPRRSVAGVTATNTAVTATGRLWALDSQSGNLVSFAAATKQTSVHVATPGQGQLTIADGQPVVLDLAKNKLILISASSGRPEQSIDVDLEQRDQVWLSGAPDDRSVYLVVASRNVLIACGFSKRSCLDPVQLGSGTQQYGAAVPAAGHVFVPDYLTGQVADVDLATLRGVQASLFDNQPKVFDLFARDGFVFYNDPNGNRAGVIDADGTVHRMAKYSQTQTSGGRNSVSASGGHASPSASPSIITTPSSTPGQPSATPSFTPPPPLITPSTPPVPPSTPVPPPSTPLSLQIELSVSPTSPLVGDAVQFAARISGGTPTQWSWTVTSSLGGPMEASAPTPTFTHVFRNAGTYQVTLMVSSGSATATKSGSVTVLPQPVLVHCGDTLTSSVTLTNDLNCQGNGLIVAANDLTIDLNGHRVTGAGVGTGIHVSFSVPAKGLQLTIQNGTLRNFATAIDIWNDGLLTLSGVTLAGNTLGLGSEAGNLTTTVSGSNFQANTTGIGANSSLRIGYLGWLQVASSSFSTNGTAINVTGSSRSSSVDNSTFTGNETGVYAYNGNMSVTNSRFINNSQAIRTNLDGTVITGNVILGSSQVGLDVNDDFYNLVVTGNTISGSGIGIRLTGTNGGTNRTIANNKITGNGAAGIYVNLNGGGVTLQSNTVSSNGAAPGGFTDPSGNPLIDGIWTNTDPNRSATIEITGNTATDNAGYGIAAYQGTDGGGNIANGNGNPAQCLRVSCTP